MRLATLACLSFAAAGTAAAASEMTTEQLWVIVQQQQRDIDELKRQLAATDASMVETEQKVEATGEFVETLVGNDSRDSATSIAGYGELHYNNLDAADSARDVDEIDFHRFVLFFGHDFSDRIRFVSELELEHSLAADGAPGEVELEQAYIDFQLSDTWTARGGLFLLPIGTLNERHEPNTFYGVERNSVENVIIPTTWWEAGGGIHGHNASGLSWDVALHSGLAIPTDGGSAFRVRSGRQKVAEARANDPAFTARLRYSGVPGLEVAASYQYQSDPSQIGGDGLDSGELLVFASSFNRGGFGISGLYGQWQFDGAAVEAADADKQSGWYVEPSYRFFRAGTDVGFYARYQDVDGARVQDRFSQWEVGVNLWPIDNVVLKFDYRSRDHDLAAATGRDFDGFDLGLGYQFF